VACKSGVHERAREKERKRKRRKKLYPDGISNQNFLATISLAQSLY